MSSKRFFLIWGVLFLCVLSFSTKPLARNIPNVSEFYSGANEMGPNKRFLGQENKRPPCKRGIVTYAVRQDDPRCHHYL
ncbi:hypothetical protein MtrunA17_Chr4g0018931 [Medicago truncatula]|uniref:RALF-like protein n=1 Tax=Medicago truncatula TaxID=3880 RepID=A0A072UUB5_MEDTR|nr:RALF-like protein [Medicago truncatula]KEH29450.1 RALF-like protein [Medicago truncatula]RHN59873.1 hypothetical protein MtrunA17_Chr4g0018931 [Medicago truncatula]